MKKLFKSFATIGLLLLIFGFDKAFALEEVLDPEIINEEVLVVLETPTVFVKTNTYNSLKIEWVYNDTVAQKYQIYRSTSKSGKYTRVATFTVPEGTEELDTLSYTDTKLKFNKAYYYKIRSYVTIEGTNVYSKFSAIAAKRVIPAAVNISGESITYLKNKLSWSKVGGASAYQVYKLVKGKYVLIKTTTSLSYIDTLKNITNTPQFTNEYKVRAYKKVGTQKIYGPFSNIFNVQSVLETPSVVYEGINTRSYKLLNSNVAGASGYELYSCEFESCVLMKDASAISETIITTSMSETKSYKIRAYRSLDEGVLYSDYSEIGTYSSKPTILDLVNMNRVTNGLKSVALYIFNNVAENSYEIYRSNSENGEYTKVETICNHPDPLMWDNEEDYEPFKNSYICIDNSVSTGQTYYYKVVTLVNESSVDYRSDFSKAFSIKVVPEKITGVQAFPYTYNSSFIEWDSLDYIDGYEVYRSTTKTGKYVKIKTITSSYVVDTSLKQSKRYYYKVRAYFIDETGEKHYGPFSDVVSRKVRALTMFGSYPIELTGSYSTSIVKSASFTELDTIGSRVIYSMKLYFSKTYTTVKTRVYYTIAYYNNVGDKLGEVNIYHTIPKGTTKNYSKTFKVTLPKEAVYWEFL